MKLSYRELQESELGKIWTIDRTEYVDAIYIFTGGKLKEKTIDETFFGWPPNEKKVYDPILRDCFKRCGYFYGGFNKGKLKAVVVLDNQWIGKDRKTLQLKFLHVDRSYRKMGIGRFLFEKAVNRAKEQHARQIYISSCETKNTVEFYKHMGCSIADEVEQYLFELEPNDIHMDLLLK